MDFISVKENESEPAPNVPSEDGDRAVTLLHCLIALSSSNTMHTYLT